MVRVKAPTGNKEKNARDTSPHDGEDAVSYERHIKALSAEYRKAKPNEGVVTELMAITFRQRRQEIVEKAMLVREVLLKFPFICHYEQVMLDFDGRDDIIYVVNYYRSLESSFESSQKTVASLPGKHGSYGLQELLHCQGKPQTT